MLFELCLQIPDVPEGACSFCLPGDVTPELFSHQSWGSTVTFQLSSHWANSKFLGFSLCAVIAFGSVSHSLQVKCTYHFRKKRGDSRDFDCYLHGWYDEKRIDSAHIFVGFDPCLVAKEKDMFSEYSEVSVEFQLEDMNGNLLPLDLCQVHECGVRLLYEDEKHRFDLIMSASSRFYPLNLDGLEARFHAKRARFQGMRLEDFSVMRRTSKLLVKNIPNFIRYSEGSYHEVYFSNLFNCVIPIDTLFSFLPYLSCLIFKRCYFNCVNRYQVVHVISTSLEM